MSKLDEKTRLPTICRKCFYRRFVPNRGLTFYNGNSKTDSCCAYILIEGEPRGCTPTDGECVQFRPRIRTKSLTSKIEMIK